MAVPKTAISVLQELVMKQGQTVQWACMGQSGPPHFPLFKYECCALEAVGHAAGRNKRAAMQEAAHRALAELALRGYDVPAPYRNPPADAGLAPAAGAAPPATVAADAAPGDLGNTFSDVALLKELCTEYRLPAPEWRLVADTGPPHLRRFEVAYCVGAHTRQAAASTKRAARQAAAAALLAFLRENLSRVTSAPSSALGPQGESDARALAAYAALQEETPWRPDLSLRVADYHTALRAGVTEEQAAGALAALAGGGDEQGEEATVEAVLKEIGLEPRWETLDAISGELQVCEVPGTWPALALAGSDPAQGRAGTARFALRYLHAMLQPCPATPQ